MLAISKHPKWQYVHAYTSVDQLIVGDSGMAVIRISDETFDRLKDIAEPLVDTPNKVINRLLDFYQNKNQLEPNSSTIEKFDPEQPPDLKFSKILEATVSYGVSYSACNWNQLNRLAIKIIYESWADPGYCTIEDDDERISMAFDIINMPNVNVRRGYYDLDGYHYDPEINVSIQNVEANRAWKNIYDLARERGLCVKIKVLLATGQEGILEYYE